MLKTPYRSVQPAELPSLETEVSRVPFPFLLLVTLPKAGSVPKAAPEPGLSLAFNHLHPSW